MMKKQKSTGIPYRSEKLSFKEFLKVFHNISIPWLFLGIAFVSSVVNTYVTGINAGIQGNMLDESGTVPVANVILYTVLTIVTMVTSAASLILNNVSGEKINLDMRKKIWRKIIAIGHKTLGVDEREQLVSRVTTDCDYSGTLFTSLASLIMAVVSFIIYTVQMAMINSQMTIASLIILPITGILGGIYAAVMFKYTQKIQGILSYMTSYLIEHVKNLTLIKTADMQKEETLEGERLFKAQCNAQIRLGYVSSFYAALDQVYNIIIVIVPFVVGAVLYKDGLVTVAAVYTFYSLYGKVKTACTSALTTMGSVNAAKGAMTKVRKTMDLPEEDLESGKRIENEDQDITLDHVSFGFQPGTLVLKDVSCVIPADKITAVIGGNGSGKSTVFKLIKRLYDPEQGQIFLGKEKAEEFNLREWRKAVCMVSPDNGFMIGTVRENILFGCEREVGEEEFMNAVKITGVDDFVSILKDGYESKVTAGAMNFSGGQRQCMALARAVLSDAKVIMMDEATSGLDAIREKAVLKEVCNYAGGRTILIIAYSISAIQGADHVIVLRDGMVEAEGSADEIINRENNYLTTMMSRYDG